VCSSFCLFRISSCESLSQFRPSRAHFKFHILARVFIF
jgi:hypothetical protein